MTTAQPSSPVATRRRGLALREILAVVVLGVVFGFLYYALDQGWSALSVAMGPLGDLAQNILIGGWFVVAPLALFVVRRPGVGVVAELIASVVEVVFLGSPVGPLLFLTALIQGVGSEVAFAATRYRRYSLPVFLASGVTTALFSFVYATIRFGWWGQSLFWVRLGLHVASGLVLCGVLAWVVARALAKTGVLRDLPAGQAGA
ncbi:MAG TPA: ECF transporter S component [Propionibacteriaceae bacterium]|nr:ECF transporter S component [Propionibacteriaceae bacterium]